MSRFGLEIRAAAAADAAGLSDLLSSAGLSPDTQVLAAQIEAVRHGGGVLLALEWGPPSGVIAFSNHPVLERRAAIAQVSLLLVAPQARRRGVGRLLLKAASQAARQAGCDRLSISADASAELAAFCEATGFVAAARTFVRPLRKRP